MERDDVHARGLSVRKQIMGAAHVEARLAESTEFMQPLQTMISKWAYGEIWTREELPRSARSLITIAMMAALGRGDELRVHVRGALNNGCTEAQIRETLLHVAVYCGIPASLEAHLIAQDVLRAARAQAGEPSPR
jgi:4-carboxymuconolactone decarboxylase